MVAGYTGEQVLFRLRSVVFAHAQRLGLDAFEDDGDAQIVTAVTADVEAIVAFLRTGLVVAVISVVTLVGILVALLAIRARLVLLIFTTMPVLALRPGNSVGRRIDLSAGAAPVGDGNRHVA